MAILPTAGDWESRDPARVARAARVEATRHRRAHGTKIAEQLDLLADTITSPMCGGPLHLLEDGSIECLADDCPNDTAVTDLLSDPEREHIVRIEEDRFHVKHPLRERINDGMLSCTIHTQLSDMDAPPTASGVYRVYPVDDESDTRALGDPRLYFQPVDSSPQT
jgi:hypothetical protein